MLGLTDSDKEYYAHWLENSLSSTPLMLSREEAKNKDHQRREELELPQTSQRFNQRPSILDLEESTSPYEQDFSSLKVNEKTPLLDKGSSDRSTPSSIKSASKNSTRSASTIGITTNSQAQRPVIIARPNQDHRASRSLGTTEERQPLLGSSVSSSTIRPGVDGRPTTFSSPRQIMPPLIAFLFKQNPSSHFITTLNNVHSIDNLIDITPGFENYNNPRLEGISPRACSFPRRIIARLLDRTNPLFPAFLGSRLHAASFHIMDRQYGLIQELPSCLLPTENSEFPKFLAETHEWIRLNKKRTQLSCDFLERIIDIQNRNLEHTEALSPHFFTAFKDAWLMEVNDLLNIHGKIKAAEILFHNYQNLPHRDSLEYTIEKMRQNSDVAAESLIKKGEGFIHYCEKQLFQLVRDQNSRLHTLQLALSVKEHLKGLHKIVEANKRLSSAKLALFEEGSFEILSSDRKKELITAAQQTRDEAYRSYQQPTFNRQQELLPDRTENRPMNEFMEATCEHCIPLFLEALLHG